MAAAPAAAPEGPAGAEPAADPPGVAKYFILPFLPTMPRVALGAGDRPVLAACIRTTIAG